MQTTDRSNTSFGHKSSRTRKIHFERSLHLSLGLVRKTNEQRKTNCVTLIDFPEVAEHLSQGWWWIECVTLSKGGELLASKLQSLREMRLKVASSPSLSLYIPLVDADRWSCLAPAAARKRGERVSSSLSWRFQLGAAKTHLYSPLTWPRPAASWFRSAERANQRMKFYPFYYKKLGKERKEKPTP